MIQYTSEAEVANLHLSVLVDEDVFGLHVSVDEVVLVHEGKPFKDFLEDVFDVESGELPVGLEFFQKGVAEEGENEVESFFDFLN